tara:strand:+ start:10717 stop:11187 length:471 start_codon:yes stop_codon:yes gene_type:complete
MSKWFTGSGDEIPFTEIVEIVKEHSNKSGKIYVGSDSFLQKHNCVFSTAICLHQARGQVGGRYFIKRTKFKANKFTTLMVRIMAEVQDSINVGMRLLYYCPQINIELHLDVSDSEKNTKTSKFSDMLIGMAKGNGFDCKIKPLAFAASSIADKHSK